MKQNLQKFFDTHHISVKDDLEKQQYWLDWYASKDRWYKYTVVTGVNKIQGCTRFSLGALSRVCTDWASLLLADETVISLKNTKASDDHLKRILADTNFMSNMQQFIERYFCVGTGALVFGRNSSGKVQVSYVDGTRCYIIRSFGYTVQAAAFVTKLTQDDLWLISIHDEGNVSNFVIDEAAREYDPTDFGIPRTEKYDFSTFVWLKPAVARRGDWSSCYGQSIFGAAIDQNKVLDIMFDGYANEFLMGRKRIFVSQDITTFKKGENGVLTPTFDPNEAVFHMLPTLSTQVMSDVNEMIKPVDMELRQQAYSKAIQDVLNYVASACFLGSNYYQFTYDIRIQMTATQVISSNSGLYRNIRKQENALGNYLKQAVCIMMALEGERITPDDIKIKWDDSIIIDEEVDKENDRQDVRDGLLSKVEYRMKWYGETEDEAKQRVKQLEPLTLNPEVEEI